MTPTPSLPGGNPGQDPKRQLLVAHELPALPGLGREEWLHWWKKSRDHSRQGWHLPLHALGAPEAPRLLLAGAWTPGAQLHSSTSVSQVGRGSRSQRWALRSA